MSCCATVAVITTALEDGFLQNQLHQKSADSINLAYLLTASMPPPANECQDVVLPLDARHFRVGVVGWPLSWPSA